VGLAAHELEHHGTGLHDHSHTAELAAAFVHGHFHEENAEDHDHGFEPPTLSTSLLNSETQVATPSFMAIEPQSPEATLGRGAPLPEPAGLSPPSPFALCVLRL
jgi:hypothetical protein